MQIVQILHVLKQVLSRAEPQKARSSSVKTLRLPYNKFEYF